MKTKRMLTFLLSLIFSFSILALYTESNAFASSNLALGKLPTSSTVFTNLSRVTDGEKNTNNYADSMPKKGLQWIQVDLGASYDISDTKMWHYFGDGREYHDVIVQLSNDPAFISGVVTVFNNDTDNSSGLGAGTDSEYAETSSGLDIVFDTINARYARFYSNGNTINKYNQYTEIEIYGSAASVVHPTSVTLNKITTTLPVGGTDALTATVLPETAENKSVTWSTSAADVATVSQNGLVTGVAAGKATITVKTDDGKLTATCAVTVTAAGATHNLAAGKSVTSSASFTDIYRTTDGVMNTALYSDSYPNTGIQWVQIDLSESNNISCIKLWHYFGDARKYHDVIVQLSNDSAFATGVTTVFNNDSNNSARRGKGRNSEYIETSSGLEIVFAAVNARYVRFYSNGSTANNYNHYVEIKMYAELPPDPLVNASTALKIPTYVGSGQAVHPCVVYTPDGWNGYKYWMAYTPFPDSNDDYENPSICASNDGINWVVPKGLTNPLVQMPATGHNCDPELIYNSASNELWLYWVEANDIDRSFVKLIKSSDGIHWSDPQLSFTDTRAAYSTISPTIDYIPSLGIYYMWTIAPGDDEATVQNNFVEIRQSADGVNWSQPARIKNFLQADCELWHIFIRYVPSQNEYWAVSAAYPEGLSMDDTRLYFAKSTDGINWISYDSPALDKGVEGAWDSSGIYRSCFVYDSATDLLRVWYSADYVNIWGIGYAENTYIKFIDNLIY